MTLIAPRLAVLTAETHGAMRLLPQRGYGFATETNAVPIGADEFIVAQAHYPIVFTASGEALAVAVLGLRDRENLFVTPDGVWQRGSYIPAYVRRYPFALVTIEGRTDRALAIDEDAGMLSEGEGEPLFEGTGPSAGSQRALNFCAAFQQQLDAARQLTAELEKTDLLVVNRAEWRRGAETVAHTFGGFRIVDEARFNNLPDATVLDWHRRRWLPLVHAHLMSMQRWRALAASASVEEAGAESAADGAAAPAAAENDDGAGSN
ncbi:MAG: SapC family protein [Alphaproteobacteria bacterium]|nr:SapC family protein [Alphaproteobacteria bacterium]